MLICEMCTHPIYTCSLVAGYGSSVSIKASGQVQVLLIYKVCHQFSVGDLLAMDFKPFFVKCFCYLYVFFIVENPYCILFQKQRLQLVWYAAIILLFDSFLRPAVHCLQETQKVQLESMAATRSIRCWATSAWLGCCACTRCWGTTTRPSKCWRTSSSTRRYG